MKIFFVLLLLFCCIEILPQQVSEADNHISCWKLGTVTGITAAGFVYGHVLQQELWWKGEKSSFHFNFDDDWEYALGADKFGHFYFPFVVSTVYADALYWSGFSYENSLICSSSFAFLYQTYVEVRDGFSKEWGFSWGDFTANTLGAAYPLIQYKIPYMKNFDFKISFYPSERYKRNSHKVIFDDYESTYNWLSLDIHNMLGADLKKYFPSFINIAIGHGVKQLDTPAGGKHELFLSLDWNVEEFPGDSKFLRQLKKYLNLYHFPAPAIKVYPNIIWYGLKF